MIHTHGRREQLELPASQMPEVRLPTKLEAMLLRYPDIPLIVFIYVASYRCLIHCTPCKQARSNSIAFHASPVHRPCTTLLVIYPST
jgi:hypothetical protein